MDSAKMQWFTYSVLNLMYGKTELSAGVTNV